MVLEFSPEIAELGVAFFRFILGAVFVAHALPKIRDPESTREFFYSVGLPNSVYWVYLAIGIEVVAGTLLAIGLYTQFAALALTFFMSLASYVAIVEMEKDFFGGYEVDLLLLVACFMFYLNGGGRYALEAVI